MSIGSTFQEYFYQAPAGDATYRYLWDAKDRNGDKVATGSYPYRTRLANDYTGLRYSKAKLFGEPGSEEITNGPTSLEPVPFRTVIEGRLPVLNRRKSPFGAGWGLSGLSQLHFDPDGYILAEDGNGTATVFSPSNVVYGIQGSVSGYGATFQGVNLELQSLAAPSLNIPDLYRSPPIVPTTLGNYLFLVAWYKVYRFNPNTNEAALVATYNDPFPAGLVAVAPNHDGSRLFVVYIDTIGNLRLETLDVATGIRTVIPSEGITTLLGGPDSNRQIGEVAVSQDGRKAYCTVFGYGYPPYIGLVAVDLQTQQATYQSLYQSLYTWDQAFWGALAVSADGAQVAVTVRDRLLLVDTAGLTPTEVDLSMYGDTSYYTAVDYTPDDQGVILRGPNRVRYIERTGGDTWSIPIVNNDPLYFPGALRPDGKGMYFASRTSGTQNPNQVGFGYELWFADFQTRTASPVVPGFVGCLDKLNLPPWSSDYPQFYPRAVLNSSKLFIGPRGEFSRIRQTESGTYVRTFSNSRMSATSSVDPYVEYDASGLQTTVQDEAGRKWTYAYDTASRLVSITHPQGEGTTLLTYGSNGLQSITDPAGRATQFEVDSHGNLIAITDPTGGGTRRFEYDSEHRMTSSVDRLNSRSQIVYDSQGKVSEVIAHGDRHTRVVPQDTQGLANSLSSGTGTEDQPASPVTTGLVASTVTDPDGVQHRIWADAMGQEILRADSSGGATQTERSMDSQALKVTDPLGRATRFTYTQDEVLRKVTYPDSTVLRIDTTKVGSQSLPSKFVVEGTDDRYADSLAYGSGGQVTWINDRYNVARSINYDTHGDPSLIQEPGGRSIQITSTSFAAPSTISVNPTSGNGSSAITQITYDSSRNPTTYTDPLGNTTGLVNDGMGRVTGITDPDGNSSHVQYDADGNVAGVTDPAGRVTTLTWAPGKRLTSVSNPMGQLTQYAYTPAGRLHTTTNFLGDAVQRAYDSLGRLASITSPVGGVVRYGYDAASQVISATDELNHVTSYDYDVRGRVAAVHAPDGAVTRFTYNVYGELETITDPSNRTTRIDRNFGVRRIQFTDPAGYNVVRNNYDQDGRLASQEDANSITTNHSYDGLGRLSRKIRLGVSTFTAEYDLAGRLAAIVLPNGGRWEYTYSPGGRLTSRKDPLGNVWNYEHDKVGNVTRVDEPGEGGARIVTTLTYDALNRPLVVQAPDRTHTFTYQDSARSVQISISPDSVQVERRFDALDRLVKETVTSPSGSRLVEYEWDVASNLTRVKQDGVAVLGYEYDAANRPVVIRDERQNRVFGLSYSASGELTQVVFPSGIKRIQAWGTRGELQSVRYEKADGTALSREAYEYDAALMLVSVTDALGVRDQYGYDGFYRVTNATYRDWGRQTLKYDNEGNVVQIEDPRSNRFLTYDQANQLTSVERRDAWPYVTTQYTHDARGNVKRVVSPTEEREYVWDTQGRLRQVLANGVSQLTNTYWDDYRLGQTVWRCASKASPGCTVIGSRPFHSAVPL